MRSIIRFTLGLVVIGAMCPIVASQSQIPAPPGTPAPAQNSRVYPPPPAAAAQLPSPAANAVAATVNGQAIPEAAVQRGLKRMPPEKQAIVRAEVVNFLIDNALLDQYLTKLHVDVDNKEVEAKLKEVRDEIQKRGSTFEKVMQELSLTEAELRNQIVAQLRWDHYADSQATDKALQALFAGNRDIFDGSMVRARHILVTPKEGDVRASEQAKFQLMGYKKQIEDTVVQGLAKLPANADKLERERTRIQMMDEAFAVKAKEISTCPSKAQGGDLGFFPRAGSMVEPFAKAAFTANPYQMGDIVTTQFGHHLILVTERRPGKEVKFDDVKDEVKEIHGERLRDELAAGLRKTARIEINAPPKP